MSVPSGMVVEFQGSSNEMGNIEAGSLLFWTSGFVCLIFFQFYYKLGFLLDLTLSVSILGEQDYQYMEVERREISLENIS